MTTDKMWGRFENTGNVEQVSGSLKQLLKKKNLDLEKVLILKSSDNKFFYVAKDVARVSSVLDMMLDMFEDPLMEEEGDLFTPVVLPFRGDVLGRLLGWMSTKYRVEIKARKNMSLTDWVHFIPSGIDKIEELGRAADYLDVPDLIDSCNTFIARVTEHFSDEDD